MKVMYLLEYPIDLPGGAQMSTGSLCQGLLASEFQPMVVCPTLMSQNQKDYDFEIITYPMGEKRIPNLLKRIHWFYKIIKKEKPEIIHIQMPESLITYGLLRGFGFSRKSQFVFTDRGLYYGYRKHSMILMKHALKYSNRFLCTTNFNQKMWKQATGFTNLSLVANTISNSFGDYREEKRIHDGFVIGFAGRICEEKNWPLVNRLCRELKNAGVQFRVSIVMSVFEENDRTVVKQVKSQLIKDIGEANVEVHLDYNQKQMADYYYGVDVFVMTSRFESFGKAAVEAMSRKCAVISTNVGGLPEVIGKEENLYSEENLKKAVAYIKELSLNQSKLKSDQEFFYHRYKEEYSQEKCLKDHLEIYREIARRNEERNGTL